MSCLQIAVSSREKSEIIADNLYIYILKHRKHDFAPAMESLLLIFCNKALERTYVSDYKHKSNNFTI